MLTGAHAIIYSKDPEADRAFLRDVLELAARRRRRGLAHLRAAAAEVAVHPAEENDVHEFYLMCDDVEAFIAEMKAKASVRPVPASGWGMLTQVMLPAAASSASISPVTRARQKVLAISRLTRTAIAIAPGTSGSWRSARKGRRSAIAPSASKGRRCRGPHAHPQVTMHTPPLADYMRAHRRRPLGRVGSLMLSSARHVVKAGADFLICPDNTVHQALDGIRAQSPAPWLHIAEEVAAVAVKRDCERLGILGTRYLMEGPVYRNQLRAYAIGCEIPDAADRGRINTVIFDELVYGRFDASFETRPPAHHRAAGRARLRCGRAGLHGDS